MEKNEIEEPSEEAQELSAKAPYKFDAEQFKKRLKEFYDKLDHERGENPS